MEHHYNNQDNDQSYRRKYKND